MDEAKKIKEEKKEHIATYCVSCNVRVEAELCGQYSTENKYDNLYVEKFMLLKCNNCQQPILTKSELVYEIDGFDWGTPLRIFPVSQFHINEALPEKLKNALTESINCYEASLFTPTVIMCRRTMDGLCRLMGIKKGVFLGTALKQLKKEEKINDQLYEWASLLKNMGNDAAHDFDVTFTKQDAKDILDFTIAILDFTYSFKQKFNDFSERQMLK